ncbi:hypothetical protein Pan216_44830 [Planctomycetes bacterium Pan216]|uniref:HEAT repeat protein n=1 Tax=Kolteria novifilia TaxID=2527975 RepID=A0A518B9F0_9BACT|nr:hypothetical protein Pan216_44830 [Planctomycetes bacterium Pan216]
MPETKEKEAPPSQEQKLIDQLANSDPGKAYQAYHALTEKVTSAGDPGKEAERERLAKVLAGALNATKTVKERRGEKQVPRYNEKVRGELARLVSLIGGQQNVEAISKAMNEIDAREAERFALDRMTDEKSTASLIEFAKNGLGPDFRIGCINALGFRQGKEVVGALTSLTNDKNAGVRQAAFNSLANQTDPSADQAFAQAIAKAQGRDLLALQMYRVRLAGTLADAGNKEAAKKVCQAITADKRALKPQQKAAKIIASRLG